MVATVGFVSSGDGDVDQAFIVIVTGYAVVGALVATREPRNAVGWLMLSIALALALTSFSDCYVQDPGRPFVVPLAWVANWIWFVWLYGAAIMLPLLFPDGRVLSARWRVVPWVGLAALMLSIVAAAFGSNSLDVESPRPMPNPLAATGSVGAAVSGAGILGGVLAAVCFGLGACSIVLRLRRSRGRRRQQVKWFAYVGGLAVVGLGLALVDSLVDELVGGARPSWMTALGAIGWMTGLLLVVVGVPAAVGIAMLRHQLYDIDVVIKRTLVYGSLTMLLGATYLALVLAFRVLLDPVTGQSDLAVAASTLAVAALFRPARARIQGAVDRRFFRSRYDAARTAEAFAERLRQEVDLEAISGELRDVVRNTIQPTHVSLWLREIRGGAPLPGEMETLSPVVTQGPRSSQPSSTDGAVRPRARGRSSARSGRPARG